MQFKQLSKKQFEIMLFPYTSYSALICDGAVRSGKTVMMTVSFVMWAMNCFTGMNFGICGKSVRSAERNIIMPLLQIASMNQRYSLKYTRSISLLTVTDPSGKENYFYIFGGKDESSYMLIQGITLAGILLDEVALMPRSFVEQALARCSVEGSKYWFNCNPDSPAHWFYTEWVQKAEQRNAMHLHFLMEDNPSLSPQKLQEYKTMYSGVFYDRYIRGQWVVAEGRVYQMFNDNPDAYILHDSTFGMDGQFFVSIDYGTLNPCSMGLWCVRGKQAIRIKEYYYSGRDTQQQKTDEEYYTELEKLTAGYYIRAVVIDPSAASFIACIRRHGKFLVRQAINDVNDGIRITSSLLSAGMLLIHESCKDCIREFGLYRWDDTKNQDTVIKENDHAMDDVRYFCNTILAREFRWDNWAASRR